VTLGSTVGVKGAAGTSAALSAVPGRVCESPGQRGSAWAWVGGALGGIRTPNLLIRRVPLGVAGFLTWASFRRFAWSGSRSPRFSGFSLADPLAACGLTL